jgi:hypothetical protein
MIIPVKGQKTNDKMNIYKIIDDGKTRHIRIKREQKCLCGCAPGVYGNSYTRSDKITQAPKVDCEECIKVAEVMDKVLFMPYISSSEDREDMYVKLTKLTQSLNAIHRSFWFTRNNVETRDVTKSIREYDIVR